MRSRVAQQRDDFLELDERAGPAMREHQRQWVRALAPDLNEMDVQPIDRGHELRQRVQSRLLLPPVKAVAPVTYQLLQPGQAGAPAAVIVVDLIRPASAAE